MAVAPNAFGDDYDFAFGLAFDRTSFDGSQTITTPGGMLFSSSAVDTDELSAFGTWYFSGLSDATGPRARAAFVDRASSLSLSYLRLDQTSSLLRRNDDPAVPVLPLDTAADFSGDSLAAEIRYVDRASGWFGTADLLSANFLAGGSNGGVNDTLDANRWSLGVGKYLFETTALSLEYTVTDSDDGFDTSTVAATFTHLGDIGERWHYAIDLGYSRFDPNVGASQDTWSSTLALYPTRDFEFGVSVEDVATDGSQFFDTDSTMIEGFASWFVLPNVQLSARYRVDDVDFAPDVFIGGASTERGADQDSFGISATIRF